MRKRIATYGRRGALVRVTEVQDGKGKRYVVQWGPARARQQQTFLGRQGKAEALAFAEAYYAEASRPKVEAPTAPITTRQLFQAFSTANFPALRVRTRDLYVEFWTRWEQYYGATRAAGELTFDDCDGFRAALEGLGLATATIQKTITCVRTVYNYAERTEKIAKNRWHTFRFRVAKERRVKPRAEYRLEEFLKIWRQFDPTSRVEWRGYVAVGLLGVYGARQRGVLHLRWPDIDFEGGSLTFAPEFDKMGQEHTYELLPIAREILAVAQAWREREGYEGPWVFFAGRDSNRGETYTLGSLWSAIKRAERDAGITAVKYRAGHGFRRGLVGDLLASGADLELALKAIGDKDIRMAQSYAIKRNERITDALKARVETFATIGVEAPAVAEAATNLQPGPEKAKAAAATKPRRRSVTPSKTEA